jgi:DNA-binding CsgD family transcriptional regulator
MVPEENGLLVNKLSLYGTLQEILQQLCSLADEKKKVISNQDWERLSTITNEQNDLKGSLSATERRLERLLSRIKTEDILSIFIPSKKSFDSNNTLPNQGEEIFLKDYNLTERQIILLKDFIENKSTYVKLAEKYNISISTVKKDMADIFTKFNVANNNELFILLSQFIVR